MEEHRDLNLFLAVLTFLLCAIISVGIPSITLKNNLKNKYIDQCYCYPDTFELSIDNFNSAALPSFEVDEETKKAVNIKYPNNEKKSVYELTYKANDGMDVNLTIVYEFDVDTTESLKFDLDSYLKKVPFDTNHNLISRDILVVYTEQIFYYIFNRGYMLSYKDNPEGVLEDYHYLNVPSWNEDKNWSMYKAQRDENGNIIKDAAGEIVFDKKDGQLVYNDNINQLFTDGMSVNVGMFSYYELQESGLKFTNLENPIQDYANIMIDSCAESVNTYSYILSIFYMVILPVLWVLVMWLVMKKNGVITRFREYYSVAAISFIVPSLIAGIVGLFIPYPIISKYIMIVQAIYYFIVVTIINGNTKNQVQSEPKEVIDVPAEKIETTPVSEFVHTETESKKPSIIE